MKGIPVGFAAVALGTALLLWTRREHLAADTSSAPPSHMPVASDGGFPLSIRLPDGRELVFAEPPTRILPANTGIVDFLSLLIDPARVVALPETTQHYSRFAGDAEEPTTGWEHLPRYGSYAAEVVFALEPDVVLTHAWQSPETGALVEQSGIPVLSLALPHRWSDVVDTLRLLGRLFDVGERATALEADLEQRIEGLARHAAERGPTSVLSYSNFGTGGSTAGAGTTLDIVFELAGVENAAARAGLDGHAALDHERLLTLDPDVIVVGAYESGVDVTSAASHLLAQPELEDLRALRSGRLLTLPTELFTSVSTELVSAAEDLQRQLDAIE